MRIIAWQVIGKTLLIATHSWFPNCHRGLSDGKVPNDRLPGSYYLGNQRNIPVSSGKISPDKSACVQLSKTELDWLVVRSMGVFGD